jgi:ubiquinone/menaquinone biosynthesis C-methylase UbiE
MVAAASGSGKKDGKGNAMRSTGASSPDRVGTENEAVREAWVQAKLRGLAPGLRLLDAGAGERRFKPYCAHLRYVAQDFAQYDGKGDAAGLQTRAWNQDGLDIVSDVTAIPEPDGSFDAILCTEVLEHVAAPIAALEEFSRLLPGGGALILTAPFCSLTHFAPFHFYSGFNSYFFAHHLQNLGFEILELEANGNFFEYIAQEVHRLPSIAQRYGGGRLGFWEKRAVRTLLRALGRFSPGGGESAELLNYGFHILARKTR